MAAPIADYGLLGDGHGAALVDRAGSVDWWCAPRFDSRASFARLLDERAGHWSLRPREALGARRGYESGSLVLGTVVRTAGGEAKVTDALALAHGAREHDVGRASPHTLVRLVEGREGEVELDLELSPRGEYGLVVPRWERTEGGWETAGGPDTLTLHVEGAELEDRGGTLTARFSVRAGERAGFVLRHRQGLLAPDAWPAPSAADLVADTIAGWRSWSEAHQAYTGAFADEVRASALVLHALTYGPTGAVVAAPTTSLPELPGGEANWDYRYAWLRDASLTLRALWVGACPEEAGRYVHWMARAGVSAVDEPVQIMFGVDGERDLTERRLEHLAGYRGARPVRVGNDAWRQRQLDVHGEVLDAVWTLRDKLGPLGPGTTEFLVSLVESTRRHWREPDAGIWEGREGERHYTSSKVMSWVALDRGVRLADRLGAGDRAGTWAGERDAVHRTVLAEGFDERRGAFTGAFGSDHLDASLLLLPLFGFLPADDPRMRSTIDLVADELADGPHVRRWTGTEERGFVIASFWLVEALALAGEVGRARASFEELAGTATDLGLLSEVFDPREPGGLAGNFPQGFSHVGLINAAWAIDRAERGRKGPFLADDEQTGFNRPS